MRYRAKHTGIGNFRSFFALLPHSKSQNSEFWYHHHFTCVPKITIIWCTVPEIWSETTEFFVIFGHFLPFYHLLPQPNDPENQNFEKIKIKKWLEILSFYKWKSYDKWFLKYMVQQTEIFCPLSPLITKKIKTLKKWKKKYLDILSFYTCVP